MEVTDSENKVLPIGVVNLLEELLVDEGGESLVEASLQTLRWLVSDLNDLLQETKGELIVGLTGYP